jgi:hypothetical protein
VYLVQGLEVGGPYTVTMRGIGYGDFVREDVYVRLSQSTRVDAQLSVQAVAARGAGRHGGRTADFTPDAPGRRDADLRHAGHARADVQPRLRRPPEAVAAGGLSGGSSGQRRGAYNRFNTITIDGANQSERFNLGSTGGVPGGSAGGKIVSMDAVKEFRVMFTPSDVRQGNFSGMLVNAVTKSGTNEFTGGGASRTAATRTCSASTWSVRSCGPSEFTGQQYGFHLGGPIIRDRLHFFIAPELQQRTRPAGGPYYRRSAQESSARRPPCRSTA